MIWLADKTLAILILVLVSPILLPVLFLVWAQDRHSPFYIGQRVAEGGQGTFGMIKVRSMVANADKSGLASTSSSDNRITGIGHFVRKTKLDEMGQLINVLRGEMSFVGPRPQVQHDVDLYTDAERKLISVRPGITDLASITFSDEGDILEAYDDADLAYNQRIRPWKSRLGLIWVERQDLDLYFRCIWLTIQAVINKPKARTGVVRYLTSINADKSLIEVAARTSSLEPAVPPGSTQIFQGR